MAIYSGFTPWKRWFSIVMLVYQRVCTVETQLETRVLQCALMGQGCFALPDTTTSFAKDSAVSFSWCQGPTEWKKNRTYSVSPTYIYIMYIYIYPYPHYITITTDYPHDVTIDVSIISPLYPNSIAMISPLFTLYPPLKTCPWYSHHIPMISQVYSHECGQSNNKPSHVW